MNAMIWSTHWRLTAGKVENDSMARALSIEALVGQLSSNLPSGFSIVNDELEVRIKPTKGEMTLAMKVLEPMDEDRKKKVAVREKFVADLVREIENGGIYHYYSHGFSLY